MAHNQSGVRMNHGVGEASYARNSTFQNAEQNRMKPMIQEAVVRLWKHKNSCSSVVVADLGCSSGKNALALISFAVDAISRYSASFEQRPPELCLLLNDLPDCDFNDVAKQLVAFQQNAQSTAGLIVADGIVPGSFYGRLFTSNSLHLVLSSNSLHWLSKAPEDLQKNEIPMYSRDDALRNARRSLVLECYARQFRKDFTQFLSLRAQELVPGGQMVFSLIGYSASECCRAIQFWDVVAPVLCDMASKGVISSDKLDSFYLPCYWPSDEELREIIEDDGSFEIDRMKVHDPMSGTDTSSINPKMVALTLRAVCESLVVQHFQGSTGEIMDEFTRTLERQLSVVDGHRPPTNVCVSLTKKTA